MVSRANLFCDQEQCHEEASAFGILDNRKSRACPSHISALVQKGFTINLIEAYSFIHSLDDIKEYNNRKQLVNPGIGNVAILETRCEEDLRAVFTELDTHQNALLALIRRCIEEKAKQAQFDYQAIREKLTEMRTEMESFLEHKDAELSDASLHTEKATSAALRARN